jgi:branched-chain amino acid transport system substrate-binding protein
MTASSKRRRLVVPLLLLLIAAALVAVYLWEQRQPIKIGYTGSLSAFNSDLGISGRNGATLAVRDINEAGGILGHKLMLVPKDDFGDPDQAVETDEAFLKENIRLIVGHMTSQMSVKTVPYINEQQILMISPTIALDSLSGQDDFFFRVIPTNKTQALALSHRMASDGIRKTAVIIDKKNLLFTKTLRDFFLEDFQKNGGQVLYTCEFESADQLSDCAQRIKTRQPEGVLIIAASESVAVFSQRMLQLGIQARIFGPAWAMTASLVEHGGKSMEGAQFVSYFDNTSEALAYGRFRDGYLATYGNEPNFASCLAYESVKVLADAMAACGSTDPVVLRQYMKTHQVFDGLSGLITFDDFGDVDRPVYIYKIEDGQFQIVK